MYTVNKKSSCFYDQFSKLMGARHLKITILQLGRRDKHSDMGNCLQGSLSYNDDILVTIYDKKNLPRDCQMFPAT